MSKARTLKELFGRPLELKIDTRLEPGVSIGKHRHTVSEEVYYLPEGTLKVTLLKATTRDQAPRSPRGMRTSCAGASPSGPSPVPTVRGCSSLRCELAAELTPPAANSTKLGR